MANRTTPPPPLPLTPTTRRAEAAGLIARHVVFPPVSAMLVAELLDTVNGAMLRSVGLSDQAAREVLSTMWRPL